MLTLLNASRLTLLTWYIHMSGEQRTTILGCTSCTVERVQFNERMSFYQASAISASMASYVHICDQIEYQRGGQATQSAVLFVPKAIKIKQRAPITSVLHTVVHGLEGVTSSEYDRVRPSDSISKCTWCVSRHPFTYDASLPRIHE